MESASRSGETDHGHPGAERMRQDHPLRLTGLEQVDEGKYGMGRPHKTAFVFQEPWLMPWLNVWNNVTFGPGKKRPGQ